METFPSTTLIVRSSTNKEDQIDESNAGKFVSVLNVNSKDRKNLQDAIDQVIKSYKKHDLDLSHEKILIQSYPIARPKKPPKYTGLFNPFLEFALETKKQHWDYREMPGKIF